MNNKEYAALVERYGQERADIIRARRLAHQENAKRQQQAKQAAEMAERTERDRAQAILRQATAQGAVVARRRILEAYVADIKDAKDRAALITMIEETRQAYFDE